MLIRQSTLEQIRSGAVTLAFRRWRRPTVRAGGSLLTAGGRLSIGAIEVIDREAITAAEARLAGYSSRESLLAALDEKADGEIHRIELLGLDADPRIELREALPDRAELDRIVATLVGMDARAAAPWVRRTLELIEARPAMLAATLARSIGQETARFKPNVRKLKALGLTESLEVGYRLSPRGQAVLARWRES